MAAQRPSKGDKSLVTKSEVKARLRGILDPIVKTLGYLGISPMAVTVAGIAISILGAILVGHGRLFLGAVVLVISGLCDTIDGSLARSSGKVSKFGAFVDSSGDRVTEMAYFTGLVFYITGQPSINNVLLFFVLVALAGSFLTSYARARAEGLGIECAVGLLERPERIALLILGLVFGRVVLTAVIVFLAALSTFTFLQRVNHVRNSTRQ